MRVTVKHVVIAAVGVGVIALIVRALQPTPVSVEVAPVARGPMRVTVDEEARTRVRNRYVVSAPVAGRVERLDVAEGDSVSADQVVARIFAQPLDPRQREAAVARLAAARDAARAADAARAQAQTALDDAKRRRDRVVTLARAGGISPEARDQSEAEVVLRAHDLESAIFLAQSAVHQVEEARAALAAGTGTSNESVALHAPVAGRVLAVPERSERVTMPGEPLLVIGNPRDLEIVADVLSTDAVKLEPGDTVFVGEWGGDQALRGVVRLVEPSGFTKVSALGVEEQRVHVIADLVDPPGPLGDGYRAEVHIVIWGVADALRVPTSALFRQGDAWAVFVVDGKRVHVRTVEIGHRNPFDAEVTGGLREGERVVLHPTDQLHEGVRVAITAPERL